MVDRVLQVCRCSDVEKLGLHDADNDATWGLVETAETTHHGRGYSRLMVIDSVVKQLDVVEVDKRSMSMRRQSTLFSDVKREVEAHIVLFGASME